MVTSTGGSPWSPEPYACFEAAAHSPALNLADIDVHLSVPICLSLGTMLDD